LTRLVFFSDSFCTDATKTSPDINDECGLAFIVSPGFTVIQAVLVTGLATNVVLVTGLVIHAFLVTGLEIQVVLLTGLVIQVVLVAGLVIQVVLVSGLLTHVATGL
jgi:hypothetical protein